MFSPEGTGRSRDSSSSGQLPTLELNDDSRVTTPSSPGSTSGESLSGLDDVSGNHSTDDLNSDVRASAGDVAADAAALSSASTSSSAPPTAGHANGHHRHVHHATGQLTTSSSVSNTHQGGTAASGSSSLSSRRRHHHHQHTLTLGTGAAKMGSSITDSAQSTEDEMFDDEKEEELDTEDDRPRILYPALATPKAVGNNFWPFGTTTNDMGQDDDQEEEEEGKGENQEQQHEQEMFNDQPMASSSTVNFKCHYGPSSTQESSSSMTARNGSTGGHSYGHGQRPQSPSEPVETALEAYRHQIHAPSGANAAFLPHEILLKILRNVRQTDDLVNTLQVCKSWCQCGVELLWNKPLFPNVGPLIKMLVVLSRPSVTFPYASFIKRLNFSQLADKMSDALLSRLCVCTRLERLTLAGCAEITDDSMTTLLATSSRNLVALDLSDCVKITDDTVRTAAKFCKKLQGLNLSGCKLVTDDGVQAIAKGCPLLRRVSASLIATICPFMILMVLTL
jgi:hypothetical protein